MNLVVVSVLLDLLPDSRALLAPAWRVARMTVAVGHLAGAVERDPAHRPRIDKGSWLATYLPDATVHLVPVIGDVVRDQLRHRAQVADPFVDAVAMAIARLPQIAIGCRKH